MPRINPEQGKGLLTTNRKKKIHPSTSTPREAKFAFLELDGKMSQKTSRDMNSGPRPLRAGAIAALDGVPLHVEPFEAWDAACATPSPFDPPVPAWLALPTDDPAWMPETLKPRTTTKGP